MAELAERSLPKESIKLFELIQSLPADLNLNSDANPLPEQQLLLGNEAVRIWQEKAEQNHWQLHSLKKKLAKMKAGFALLTTQQQLFRKVLVAIQQNDGKDIELEYFDEKLTSLNRKILPFGQMAQLRLQLSIDMVLAEADIINQKIEKATANIKLI